MSLVDMVGSGGIGRLLAASCSVEASEPKEREWSNSAHVGTDVGTMR
jgi:hypothetical protein